MATVAESTPALRRFWRGPAAVATLAVSLLVCSWVLARWPLVRQVTDIEDINVGGRLLIVGGLPWLVQWSAVSVICYWVSRRWLKLDRSTSCALPLPTLIVGTAWWIGRAVYLWSEDPLEATVGLLHNHLSSKVLWGSTPAAL